MSRFRASLLLHRGHGPRHGDLVLESGARCLTLRVARQHGRWQVSLAEPHRRRYLTYRGPLSGGRGVVRQLWQGSLDGWCSVHKGRWSLKPNHMFLLSLWQSVGPGGKPPTDLFSSQAVTVVRPAGLARLLRS